jgi:hemolysin activation/secretion protein
MGQRKHVIPVTNIAIQDSASSLGAGVRWNWNGLDLNVSYAHVLNGIAGGTPRGHDKLDFSLFYRF